MKTIVLLLACVVLVGCTTTRDVPSLADLVIPQKPLCIPDCAKCVALPTGWTLGECGEAGTVEVPQTLFDGSTIGEKSRSTIERVRSGSQILETSDGRIIVAEPLPPVTDEE